MNFLVAPLIAIHVSRFEKRNFMNNLQVNKSGRLKEKPVTNKSYIISLLKLRCNHCREGNLFINKSSYGKRFMEMHEKCPVCSHPTEIEAGLLLRNRLC